MKKTVKIVFALLFMAAVLCITVTASEFEWNLEGDTLVVSGAGKLPDFEHSGQVPWNDSKYDIKHIVIESGITYVGNFMFSGCVFAESVILPEGLKEIGIQSFAYCSALTSLYMPDSVRTLGYEAFYGCIALKDLKLSENLKSIPWSTFSICEALESVYIPDSVEFIDYYAFKGCKALKSVRLGKARLGQNVFGGCPKLVEVITDSEISHEWEGIPFVYTDGMDNFRIVNSYKDSLFTDVKPSDWFKSNVEYMYNVGIMMGSGADIFEPQKHLTYAHAVTMAARLHSIYYTGKADFVQGDVWYGVYLDYCVKNGLVENVYDMNAYITREAFVRIINVLPACELVYSSNLVPPDTDNGIVKSFYTAGILGGRDSSNNFYPDSYITRAEISTVISRLLNKKSRL